MFHHFVEILMYILIFSFSCDQAALWMFFSVRLSVCVSVTPFWLCSHHRIIMKFSGGITNDRSDVHTKGQSQSSKVKVTEVMTPFRRFRTVTPVWIHIWRQNDAHSLMLLRRGAILFSRSAVKFQGHTAKKSSILTYIGRFRTVTPVWIYQWLWNDAWSVKQHRRSALLFSNVICQFSRSHGTKNRQFWPELSVSGL